MSHAHTFIHRWANTSPWEAAQTALASSPRVILWGPPGVGKSFLVAQSGRRRYAISLCEDHTVQELVGHYVPSGREFRWHDGPVALAMREGAVLILNDLGRASGAVADFFLGVLDDPDIGGIALPTGETLIAAAGFAVVATSNSPPTALDAALRSRFDCEIHLESPNPMLVQTLNEALAGVGDALADSFMDPARALDPRKVLAMVRLIRTGVPARPAAFMCFGDAAPDLVSALTARGVELS